MDKQRFLTPRSHQRRSKGTRPLSLVELKHASKWLHGGSAAFDDVSFRIKPGERWIIFSRNAASANSLIQCLSGQQKLDTGVVRIEGHISWPLGQPQGISSLLSAAENSRFLAGIYGNPDKRPWELELIKSLSRLDNQGWHQPLKKLSMIQQRIFKLAISMAFDFDLYVVNPSAFRMLNRYGVWDEKWRRILLKRLKQRALITQGEDAFGIARLCKYGLVLEKGRIAVMGSVESCRTYLNPRQAA